MNLLTSAIGAVLLCAALAAPAAAGLLYDESVDGDAPPLAPTGDVGTVLSVSTTPNVDLGTITGLGQNTVIGSVEGSETDEVDIYEFVVLGSWQLDILLFSPGTGNDTSAFRLHSDTALNLSNPLASLDVSGPETDIFAGVNGPGTYRISIFETQSTSPDSYEFSITVTTVSEPATLGFFGLGLAALGTACRRRRPH